MGDRREQLQRFAIVATAAAQHLAIDGELGQRPNFLLGQPTSDKAGEPRRIDLVEDPLKG